MGLRPIRGKSQKGKRKEKEGGGPAALGGTNGAHLVASGSLGRPSHVGFSPTWLSQGRWPPSSTYIYGCPFAQPFACYKFMPLV